MVAVNGAGRRCAEEQGATRGIGRVNVPRLGDLKSRELVRDEQEKREQGCTAPDHTKNMDIRTELGAAALGQNMKDIAFTRISHSKETQRRH